jgi:mycobactin lysine-N-oxygenase
MFLRGFRPAARFTIYTPMLPMSRGESFLENRVFSNPDEVEWTALDQRTRRDFVKHSDRGVFDPPSLAAIAYDERCRFVTGRVTEVFAARGGAGVRLRHESAEGVMSPEHDYVVNCTGFDLLAQLRGLFPDATGRRSRRGRQALGHPGGDRGADRAQPRAARDGAAAQIPGLAGLSQGPGFRQPRRAGTALEPGAAAAVRRAGRRAARNEQFVCKYLTEFFLSNRVAR